MSEKDKTIFIEETAVISEQAYKNIKRCECTLLDDLQQKLQTAKEENKKFREYLELIFKIMDNKDMGDLQKLWRIRDVKDELQQAQ
jgi:hypothetical protein